VPAKWQKWYPHNIDAWQSSPTIQDLSDAAYRAYHNLIQAQYQAEDGMLPSEEKELIRLSRMRAVWPEIREELLACFQVSESGRIFSPRQFKEWEKAQVVHSKRVSAAKKTNKKRQLKRAVTAQSPGHIDIDIDSNSNNTNTNTKEQKQKPSRAKREPDSRHTPFRQALETYWDHKGPGNKLPWDGREAKALSSVLAASPDLTLEQFRGLLQNRARSQVTHGERIYLWIMKIHSYTEPLDRFNKPEASNGRRETESPAIARQRRNRENLTNAIIASGDYASGHADAENFSLLPEPRVERGDVPGISGSLPDAGPIARR